MLQGAKNLLKKHFGYNEFRKAQEKVLESILKKEDTVALCYRSRKVNLLSDTCINF